MEDKTYAIALSDGTTINDLTLNGTCFVSQTALNYDIFDGNCSPVVISDGESSETHANMELIKVTQPVSGEFWFALRDIPPSKLEKMQLEANLEYLAMMAGVEL